MEDKTVEQVEVQVARKLGRYVTHDGECWRNPFEMPLEMPL